MTFRPEQLNHHGPDLLGCEREVQDLIGYRVEVGTEVHRSIRERSKRWRSLYD